ncbi:MAG TPA: nitroreductase family protein [Acidimicrobiales bacterium]|jgi:nitroreductase|nr:nitroreductase family protein [Acidimicrobiales bacterium]
MDTELTPTDDLDEIERRLAMPLVEAMVTQRAVRRVLPDPVAPGIVRRCIELALEGPTGSNGQNWEFVVVTDQKTKARLQVQYRRIWALYGRAGERVAADDPQTARILASVRWQVEHFTEVPVVVVACLRGGANLPYVPMPAMANTAHYGSIYPSVQNLLLAARAVGLGASLITLPLWSVTVARRILGLPLSVEPCCVVPLGWPRGRYGPKPRKPVDQVIHLERYGTAAPAE